MERRVAVLQQHVSVKRPVPRKTPRRKKISNAWKESICTVSLALCSGMVWDRIDELVALKSESEWFRYVRSLYVQTHMLMLHSLL